MVDQRARRTPPQALGSLTETRQLLFAALLMADDIKEIRAGAGIADPAPPPPDPAVAAGAGTARRADGGARRQP